VRCGKAYPVKRKASWTVSAIALVETGFPSPIYENKNMNFPIALRTNVLQNFSRTAQIVLAVLLALGSTFSYAATDPALPIEKRLDQHLASFAKEVSTAPGVSVSVVWDGGKKQWSGAKGMADVEKRIPLSSEQLFRIASVTKVYTSTTILALAERGAIELSAPIASYLDVKTVEKLRAAKYEPDAISVWHLLAHVSGLPDYAMSEPYMAIVQAEPTKKWTMEEQLDIAMTLKPIAQGPGVKFAYSDTGYILLGQIIERTTGQKLNEAIASVLQFEAHGWRKTRFEQQGESSAADFAHAYIGGADTAYLDPSFDLYGGGGLISTVDELVEFIRATYRGELFSSPATLAAALTIPPTTQLEPSPYALMGTPIQVGRHLCWGHVGFWGVLAMYCPTEDVAMAITMNSGGGSDSALVPLATSIVEVVAKHSPGTLGEK
jgi:D-alanyl-D-alanine carboxypeptidase